MESSRSCRCSAPCESCPWPPTNEYRSRRTSRCVESGRLPTTAARRHSWLVGLWAGELQRREPALPMRRTDQDVVRRDAVGGVCNLRRGRRRTERSRVGEDLLSSRAAAVSSGSSRPTTPEPSDTKIERVFVDDEDR